VFECINGDTGSCDGWGCDYCHARAPTDDEVQSLTRLVHAGVFDMWKIRSLMEDAGYSNPDNLTDFEAVAYILAVRPPLWWRSGGV
jgi:hypothetical protein